MKKYSLQEWLGKLALSGVLIGLFAVAAFTPEINSFGTGISSPDGIISALNSQSVQPVFTGNVEYINLAEPVNGSISKCPRQLKILCRRFTFPQLFIIIKLPESALIAQNRPLLILP